MNFWPDLITNMKTKVFIDGSGASHNVDTWSNTKLLLTEHQQHKRTK